MNSVKQIVKNFIPSIVLKLYIEVRYKLKRSNFKAKPLNEIFIDIYRKNHWGNLESISGDGSTLDNTRELIDQLNILFSRYRFKSVLDLPCGDFNWFRHVNRADTHYTGADIVPGLIESNKIKFQHFNDIEFCVLDIVNSKLPKVDLIFSRDCLVHLSYNDIKAALANVKKSCSSYFMATTFPNRRFNYDINTGDWRPINLQLPPFNLPGPLILLKENKVGKNEILADKSLGLWRIDDL
jgi:SAM-dependent methyltransferase